MVTICAQNASVLRTLLCLGAAWAFGAQMTGCRATLPAWVDQQLDRACRKAVQAHQVPGVVLVVGRGERVLKESAYGLRRCIPENQKEPMALDTLFDLASLTKVVGTATALCLLMEEGRMRLDDPVKKFLLWWPSEKLTVRHLATHTSGFAPYLPAAFVRKKYPHLPPDQAVLAAIRDHTRRYPLGKGFAYSCLNYLLLARVLEAACGMSLETFLRKRVWSPLGMKETTWRVPPEKRRLCAPTENGLTGRVHDPLARLYGAGEHVSGNAGLFSTGRDLARFMAALACGGSLHGTGVLKKQSVDLLFANQAPASSPTERAVGWVIAKRPAYLPYPGCRTVRYHKGFTGALLWIDLRTGLYVVLLTSRLHPRAGNAEPLRTAVVRTVAHYAATLPEHYGRGSTR